VNIKPDEKILIGCNYRPPTASYEVSADVNKTLRAAKLLVESKKYTNLLIAGDFNYRYIKWYQGVYKFKGKGIDTSLSRNFVNAIESYLLTQAVAKPTFGGNF
jgi:hypothetical protein